MKELPNRKNKKNLKSRFLCVKYWQMVDTIKADIIIILCNLHCLKEKWLWTEKYGSTNAPNMKSNEKLYNNITIIMLLEVDEHLKYFKVNTSYLSFPLYIILYLWSNIIKLSNETRWKELKCSLPHLRKD